MTLLLPSTWDLNEVMWDFLSQVKRIFPEIWDAEKDRIISEMMRILDFEAPAHNSLSSKVQVIWNNKDSISWRWVEAIEDIWRWELVIKFWWCATKISDWVMMREEIRMWHIMIWAGHTIWSSREYEIDPWDFVNHSCEPNCWVVWHLDLLAMRDIKKGEEISFDYWSVLWPVDISQLSWELFLLLQKEWVLDTQWIPTIIEKCECWSPKCRKTITWNDWKNLMLREEYTWFFPHHIQKMIEKR